MDDRFKHHPPKGDATIDKHQAARIAADAFFKVIEDIAPAGREKALSITKAEEAMFWLNASIARNQ
jgi:hypothetical protein